MTDGIEFSPDRTRIDFAQLHRWLADTYWSPGIPRELVERAAANSAAVMGAYQGGRQVGFERAVSDTVRFGYIADVYVEAALRNRGIARRLVAALMDQPALREVQNWYLLTKDAQGVYAKLGFAVFEHPELFMVLRRPSVVRPGHPSR